MTTQEDANQHFDERLQLLEAGSGGGGGAVDPDLVERLTKLEDQHDDDSGHDSGDY